MVPLIDVLMVLIIFFLVTMQFRDLRALNIKLPKIAKKRQTHTPKWSRNQANNRRKKSIKKSFKKSEFYNNS